MIELIGDRGDWNRINSDLADKLNKEAELEGRKKPETPKTPEGNHGIEIHPPVPLQTQASIKPRTYIQVPNIKGLFGKTPIISTYELQGYNSLNWQDTHFKLLDSGLYMPTPAIFMAHFTNVVDAFQGKSKSRINQSPSEYVCKRI